MKINFKILIILIFIYAQPIQSYSCECNKGCWVNLSEVEGKDLDRLLGLPGMGPMQIQMIMRTVCDGACAAHKNATGEWTRKNKISVCAPSIRARQ